MDVSYSTIRIAWEIKQLLYYLNERGEGLLTLKPKVAALILKCAKRVHMFVQNEALWLSKN